MARNPFRKPYVFSIKWAIWLGLVVPFVLYTDLTSTSAKKSDRVSTTLTVIVLFALVPWTIMRISRSVKGKSPQGKSYDDAGDIIEGHVLDLKLGYWPRVKVQARLVDGVVEIPTGKISVGDIKSIKVKDPRPLLVKLPLYLFGLGLGLLYLYFILQPLLLLIFIEIPHYVQKLFNGPQLISRDQMYEQLHTQKYFSHVIHSQALLQPTLIALFIILIALILKPYISKTALVIRTNNDDSLLMPFSPSLNPYIWIFIDGKRCKRFIKKVMKTQKRSRKSADE